jgi:hypothetical protein
VTRLRIAIALLAAVIATPAAFAAPVFAGPVNPDLLPDLQMAPLFNLYVSTTPGGSKRLRFGTLVNNVGDGAIEVRGKRRVGNEMTRVVQYVYRGDGTGHAILKPNATLHYSGDGHDHFHIERFIRTTLKPMPGNPASIKERRGRKLGFCLVDTLKLYTNVPPNATANPAYFGCGNSTSQHVRMGISVGWGDVYTPELAFQAIDVTNLPAGAYKICATVNPAGLWTEKGSNSANNSYWLELNLDAANNQVSTTGSGDTPC